MVTVYPLILIGLEDDSPVDNTLWGTFWTIFVISILYGIKIAIILVIESFLYEDLGPEIRNSLLYEELLIKLEKSKTNRSHSGISLTSFDLVNNNFFFL